MLKLQSTYEKWVLDILRYIQFQPIKVEVIDRDPLDETLLVIQIKGSYFLSVEVVDFEIVLHRSVVNRFLITGAVLCTLMDNEDF